jgi:hypothetical protein
LHGRRSPWPPVVHAVFCQALLDSPRTTSAGLDAYPSIAWCWDGVLERWRGSWMEVWSGCCVCSTRHQMEGANRSILCRRIIRLSPTARHGCRIHAVGSTFHHEDEREARGCGRPNMRPLFPGLDVTRLATSDRFFRLQHATHLGRLHSDSVDGGRCAVDSRLFGAVEGHHDPNRP